jgi:winged helix DNA-binding protein
MIARWWGGGRMAAISRALTVVPDPVVEADIEGTRGLLLESDVAELAEVSPEHPARLLPGFDPFTNELPRRVDSVLAPADHNAVHRVAGWVTPILVIDGRVAGTWEIASGNGGAGSVAVRPFRPWRGGARRELRAEVERIAAFLDRPLRLEVSSEG